MPSISELNPESRRDLGRLRRHAQQRCFHGHRLPAVTNGPPRVIALSLTSGSNPSTYGDSLTFTAAVTGNSPSGTVQLIVDGCPPAARLR